MIRVSFRTDFKILVHILDGTCIFFIVIEANAKYKGLTCPISKPIQVIMSHIRQSSLVTMCHHLNDLTTPKKVYFVIDCSRDGKGILYCNIISIYAPLLQRKKRVMLVAHHCMF